LIKPIKDFTNDNLQKCRHFLVHILFLILHRFAKERQPPEKINKILLIRRNRLGDAINLLPIIEMIRKKYPLLKICVLAETYNAEIFRYSKHINKIFALNENSWGGRNFFFLNPVVRAVKKENFDLVIAFGGYTSTLAKLVYCIKPKYSAGVISNKRLLFDLVYDKKIKPSSNISSHVEDMAQVARASGLKIAKSIPYTHLELIEQKNHGWLAICPDVERPESQYPIDQYGEVIKKLLKERKIKKIILLIKDKNSPYIKLTRFGAQYIETRNLHDLIKHLATCSSAITAEGGSAHIAAALGLSVCVISGTKNQSYWKPHARKIKTFMHGHGVKQIRPEKIAKGIYAFK
jgi:ADP-heptose:LPS heptosyltransferase